MLIELNEIQVVYKRSQPIEWETFKDSKDTVRTLRQLMDDETLDIQEQFLALFLNRNNQPIGFYPTSKGGLTGTVADPRLVLAAALKYPCTAIILCHNHPSGNLKPSKADEDLTTKFNQAAKLLDLKLLDHIILTREGYFSFTDEGLI